MLTLKQRVISDKRRGLAEPDGNGAAHSVVYVYTPMACESLVADAMCHLLAAFVMIQNPSRSSRTYDGSPNALDLANENICMVLERLSECSYAFWMLPKRRNLVLARVHEYCDVFKRKYRAWEDPHVTEIGSKRQFLLAGVSLTAIEENARETETTLAVAILQLIDAYRAIDALSASPFPAGAPYSFELACYCLCTALVSLEECSKGCEP